jgi:hypothetical protein
MKGNKMVERQKTRFRLLPYQILARRWMVPAILLIPAGIAFRWGVPQIEIFESNYADFGWVISIVGGLLTVYAIMASLSCVVFQKERFILRAPLYPLAVSYKRIKLVHPIELRLLFPKKQIKRMHYRLYYKLWGMTVPVVMLEGLPLPRWWIKLWFHPLLIHPDEDGIILVVKDWMGCSRALDSMRTDPSKTPWHALR